MADITDGIFLPMTTAESEQLDKWLADNDYDTGPDGIREALLDLIHDEYEPAAHNSAQRVADYLANNPELLNGAGAAITGASSRILEAIKKARRK